MSAEHPLRTWIELGGGKARLGPRPAARPGEHTFEVRDLSGVEAISTPFRFEARFAVPVELALDPEALVRTEASLILGRDRRIRTIDGIATEVRVGAARRGTQEVLVVLEPRLALSRHRVDIRIFRDRTAVQSIVEVLAAYGIEPVLRLRETYAVRPYNVQFRESDFNFVSRLMEDEGIFYYFMEGDVLVLGDSPAAYEPIPGDPRILFRTALGLDQNQDAIIRMGEAGTLVAGKVTLRDFNPDHPRLDMDVSELTTSPALVEYYDYPGEYATPAEGRRKARLYQEELACEAEAYSGESSSARLAPGFSFDLEGSPAEIPEHRYLITGVTHDYHRHTEGFSVRFGALDASLPYRPARVTPVPRLTNPLTGIVTVPPGEDDIHTDSMGRVKVHFHWDRLFPYDDTCSHWVPVLQDNTGHSSAMPRRGWEVLVQFLEGDPDRPVVLGRLYNGLEPFHEVLPQYKTRTGLRSLSTPTRDGFNEIRFEDAAGMEEIFMHAERDQNVRIANDKSDRVLVSESGNVQGREDILIGNDQRVVVHNDLTPTVEGSQLWSVGAARIRKVAGSETDTVLQARELTIGGDHRRTIAVSDTLTTGSLSEDIGGSLTERSGTENICDVDHATTVIIGGALVETAGASRGGSTNTARVETIAGHLMSAAGEQQQIQVETSRATTIGGSLTMTAAEKAFVTGRLELSTQSLSAALTGAEEVTLKVGETALTMKGGLIQLKSASTIEIAVSGPNDLAAGESYQI